jgi:hypothetical protein
MNFLNEKIWSATIEEAKAKAVASPEWLRTNAKADQLLRRASTYWSFAANKGELRMMSGSSDHIYTIKSDAHTCPAVLSGKACYHEAAQENSINNNRKAADQIRKLTYSATFVVL